jgi:hypothetical protein
MRLALALALLSSSVLIGPAFAAPSYMIGTWFGTGQPNDRSSMYIDRMRPDGSWRGEYRTCFKGKAQDQIQEGRWALQGDILLLNVHTMDGMPMPRVDRYRMLQHSDKAQKYIELPMQFAYTPTRVPDGYKMPACDLVS